MKKYYEVTALRNEPHIISDEFEAESPQAALSMAKAAFDGEFGKSCNAENEWDTFQVLLDGEKVLVEAPPVARQGLDDVREELLAALEDTLYLIKKLDEDYDLRDACVNGCAAIAKATAMSGIPQGLPGAAQEMLEALQRATNYYGEGVDETDPQEVALFEAMRTALARGRAAMSGKSNTETQCTVREPDIEHTREPDDEAAERAYCEENGVAYEREEPITAETQAPPKPTIRDALEHVRSTLKLRHIGEASDDEVEEALTIADEALAGPRD